MINIAFENFFFILSVRDKKNLFRIIHESHLAILYFLYLPFYDVLEG